MKRWIISRCEITWCWRSQFMLSRCRKHRRPNPLDLFKQAGGDQAVYERLLRGHGMIPEQWPRPRMAKRGEP